MGKNHRKNSSVDNALPREINLDLTKAIAISLVLFWHLQPIQLLVTDEATIFIKIMGFVLAQFYQQVSLLAVPMFLLVSLYLFYQKIDSRTIKYTGKRCLRIGKVYLFWTICQFAFFYLVIFIMSLNNGVGDYAFPIPIHRLVMEGGPPLPVVGGSVFYFLFVLLILVLISAVFYALKDNKKTFVGISIVIASILYFEIINLGGSSLPYWRVDNFLVYIPLSYFILLKKKRGDLIKYIPYFYVGFILFSAHDFYLRNQGSFCHLYSRISIVFGSIALFSSILQIKSLKQNVAISLMSKYSLGVFAIHKYWQLIVFLAFHYCGFSTIVYASSFPLNLHTLNIAMITTVLTFCAVLLGGHTFLKKYLT